jgi:hypothetical protein
LIYVLFFLVAFSYALVGLGGGTAYSALLTFTKTPPSSIPATSLFLNMTATIVGFFPYRFHFPLKKKTVLFYLFLSGMAGTFLGASLPWKERIFFLLLGSAVTMGGFLSLWREKGERFPFSIPESLLPFLSFPVGVLAGITGIGGGVYLSPVLLSANFPVKEIASITSLYIFLNSASGFLVKWGKGEVEFSLLFPLVFFVVAGGYLGSSLGARRIPPRFLRFILGWILIVIGVYIFLYGTGFRIV